MRVLDTFRKRREEVLVATDLAARGLDVPTIFTVVSYDAARDIETHTHRVGRTGRAGAAGEAFTLLTTENPNRRMAAQLVTHLEQVKCPVSAALRSLCNRPSRGVQTGARQGAGSWRTEEPVATGTGASRECSRSRSRSRSRSPTPPTP